MIPLNDFLCIIVIWDKPKISCFKKKFFNVKTGCCIVDIGSNVGLFTRQLINLNVNNEFYCYEPDEQNFKLLERNLASFCNVQMFNFALGTDDETRSFYCDTSNAGNYSFFQQAVPQDFEVKTCVVKDISVQEKVWSAIQKPIVYKSDTQGLDETLICAIDLEFWKSVHFGSIEIWNIEKPMFDIDRFALFLENFHYKYFESNPKNLLSTNDIIKFCSQQDDTTEDLIFFK